MQILATGKGEELFETAEKLGEELEKAGIKVLFDDRRKVSAGVKFADYELLGVPFGIVVGRGLKDGKVELRNRREGTSEEVPVEEAVARFQEFMTL